LIYSYLYIYGDRRAFLLEACPQGTGYPRARPARSRNAAPWVAPSAESKPVASAQGQCGSQTPKLHLSFLPGHIKLLLSQLCTGFSTKRLDFSERRGQPRRCGESQEHQRLRSRGVTPAGAPCLGHSFCHCVNCCMFICMRRNLCFC